jgi:hypothetical protein
MESVREIHTLTDTLTDTHGYSRIRTRTDTGSRIRGHGYADTRIRIRIRGHGYADTRGYARIRADTGSGLGYGVRSCINTSLDGRLVIWRVL